MGGVILTPKRGLKNSFSGVKVTPDIEELKSPQVKEYPLPNIFTPCTFRVKLTPRRVKTTHVRSKSSPISELF